MSSGKKVVLEGVLKKANFRNASASLAIKCPYISITYPMQARTPALRYIEGFFNSPLDSRLRGNAP